MNLRFWRQKWSRTEVRFSFHPAPPRELSIKKKFDPIRSSTKNFLNSGVRGGKSGISIGISPLGRGVPKNMTEVSAQYLRVDNFVSC
ncbi:MAG: hypothetical protein GY820_18010 [Gammaproteobacteria bacterium]|nr:hypothetical protein [Gammaproteobacteria bacterium]